MVDFLNDDPLCERIVLCTNAVTMPLVFEQGLLQEEKSVAALAQWMSRFKKPFQLTPHHAWKTPHA
jgi:hypothetical protein